MHIYIFVDMEGISGVSNSEFVKTDGRHYAEARRYYTADTNACIRGCFQAGATRVTVRDGHGGGDHMLLDELDPRAGLVQGPGNGPRMPGLDGCQALVLLGYHAMAGTYGAVMEHTYSSASIQNMWLGGRLVGEFGIDAGIAADRHIPTIMVSGDDKVCAEALQWVPEVVTCEVKQGLSCQGARLLPLGKAHALVEQKAAEAVSKIEAIPPMRVGRPVTLRQEVIERGPTPAFAWRPDLKQIDGRTWEVTADTVEEALFRLR